MTPFAKWLRNLRDKTLGTFAEGPALPKRFEQLATEFGNLHAKATRREWKEFSVGLARMAWREAYVRGDERGLRDPDVMWRTVPPELAADAIDPDWRWRPALGEQLANPDDFVEDEETAASVIDLRRHAANPPDD